MYFFENVVKIVIGYELHLFHYKILL